MLPFNGNPQSAVPWSILFYRPKFVGLSRCLGFLEHLLESSMEDNTSPPFSDIHTRPLPEYSTQYIVCTYLNGTARVF